MHPINCDTKTPEWKKRDIHVESISVSMYVFMTNVGTVKQNIKVNVSWYLKL